MFYFSCSNRTSNSPYLSNRALISASCFACKDETPSSDEASSSSLMLFTSRKSNTCSLETRVLLVDLRTRSLRLDPYLPFSLPRSLGCIHSPSLPSFILSQLLSHLQAFLSRSRIVNSRFVSVSRGAARRVAQVCLLYASCI